MKAAVIIARGGSKRIPRKNILSFYGKPMIAWSIEAAINANIFDSIIVSTDDAEIAAIAKEWGAEVPFERPAELANDFATTADVMEHATDWLSRQNEQLESVCCIYPTAPFLIPKDIIAGYKALSSAKLKYAFSVTVYEMSVFRAFLETSGGGVEMIFPEYSEKRSQDLPDSLHDAAQFYWGKKEAWLSKAPIFARHSAPVKIPFWRVVDIDELEDLERAISLAPEIYSRLSI